MSLSQDTDPLEERRVPEPEPQITGTLFIMILFLMALGAMWGLMYLTLIGR